MTHFPITIGIRVFHATCETKHQEGTQHVIHVQFGICILWGSLEFPYDSWEFHLDVFKLTSRYPQAAKKGTCYLTFLLQKLGVRKYNNFGGLVSGGIEADYCKQIFCAVSESFSRDLYPVRLE